MYRYKGALNSQEFSKEELDFIIEYFNENFGIGYLWDYAQKAIRENPLAADRIIDEIADRVDFRLFNKIDADFYKSAERWLESAKQSGLGSWIRHHNIDLDKLKIKAADPEARMSTAQEIALELLVKYPDLSRWP
jgi:hypothetical protein